MSIDTVNQFSPSVSRGDGITNALFYTQKILLDLGFNCTIYSDQIEAGLESKVKHIDTYIPDKDQILLYHYAIWHAYHEKIMQFLDRKVLVYHNITPLHFFKDNPFMQKICSDARQKQIIGYENHFVASCADSNYNAKELLSYGYPSPRVLPVLVDIDSYQAPHIPENILKKYQDSYNLIFVGRIVPNKSQDMLIDTLYFLKKHIKNIKLIMIGSVSDERYKKYLKQKIDDLRLGDSVDIVGRVSQDLLMAYYGVSDIYLSMSEHEGFGMPLLEASRFDIPVLAYNCGGVRTAIGQKGLLNFKAPQRVAQKIIDIKDDYRKRFELLKYQREYIKFFTYRNTKNRLAFFLKELGCHIKKTALEETENPKKINYIIEGAFDSSYSLAMVNRNLAKALSGKKDEVKLYSTEGYGDFKPDMDFLSTDKFAKKLY